jgi:hypothetical protein
MKIALSSPESIRALREAMRKKLVVLTPEMESQLTEAERLLSPTDLPPVKPFQPKMPGAPLLPGPPGRQAEPYEFGHTSTGDRLFKALRHPGTKKIMMSLDEVNSLSAEQRKAVSEAIAREMPQVAPKVDDSEWKDILSHPVLYAIAERLYGKGVVRAAHEKLMGASPKQKLRTLKEKALEDLIKP